ncbi:MAG: hypothetical protein COB67_04150 [SAR324 cluster bacterium]|uniref:N-acetyltransferase domain-containing protein n=1 Tax=SAR324 cluster bacterium TaxID=2024889 RepID=A0A2A4T8J3_9DELT|nr:MAG: hypothetical protein COB67_04150 [SAR324 cluster bacterium]
MSIQLTPFQKNFTGIVKIDPQNEQHVLTFRKALFTAFYESQYSVFCRENYLYNTDRQEMDPGVSYYEVESFFYVKSGIPICGLSINYNSKKLFQCEKIGFNLSAREKQNTSEGLHFFYLGEPSNMLEASRAIKEIMVQALLEHESPFLFCTAPHPALLRFYRRMGLVKKDHILFQKSGTQSWLMRLTAD